MQHERPKTEFLVQNHVRAIILILLFAVAFLVSVWLIPFPFSWLAILALIATLPMVHQSNSLNQLVHEQIFDRIQMQQFGVEYKSGVFGESWLRPYNEFRIESKESRWLLMRYHVVRLKHRVLPNLLLTSTRSKADSEQLVFDLTNNSRLKLLKRGEA